MSTAPGKPTYKVRFLPDGVQVEVPRGETLLNAARKAGVYISSICGGDGICGKCRVILTEGDVESAATTLLSREDIRKNYVLACQSRVVGDVTASIPEESRLEEGRIVLDEDAHRFSELQTRLEDGRFKTEPLVQKLPLELTPPCSGDSLADHERIYRGICKVSGISNMQTGFQVLRQLPKILEDSDYQVTATVGRRASTTELVQVEKGNTAGNNYGIAVDVGTTTVVAHLLDLNTGRSLAAEATYNSQMQYGEDYIRRIMYVMQNDALELMQQTIVSDINELVSALARGTGIRLHDITAVICAGNTAMTHFLLGLDPSRIRKEPYVPTANSVPPFRAAQVGIKVNSRGLIYCLPSVGAYVGSDITAGVLATGVYRSEDVCLFVDIGTNGEVVLGNKEWLVSVSCSAGPAFEGSGVKHGMRAARGAIERVRMLPDLSVQYNTIGNHPPRGICGSGLLDTIAELFLRGVLDRRGQFIPELDCRRLREAEGVMEYVLVDKSAASIGDDITINQHDINNLMRSKAAVHAAVSLLLKELQMSVDEITRIYLAGGFGSYLDVNNAITIGMLPEVPASRIKFAGNTSIAGAKACLVSRDALIEAEKLAGRMTYMDLMGNPKFMDEFIQANFLPHTNVEDFPEVMKRVRQVRKQGVVHRE